LKYNGATRADARQRASLGRGMCFLRTYIIDRNSADANLVLSANEILPSFRFIPVVARYACLCNMYANKTQASGLAEVTLAPPDMVDKTRMIGMIVRLWSASSILLPIWQEGYDCSDSCSVLEPKVRREESWMVGCCPDSRRMSDGVMSRGWNLEPTEETYFGAVSETLQTCLTSS
jgi:hypothetical protein